MDTTGAHINGQATPKDKSAEFSKDELSAILKFGAQNLYVHLIISGCCSELELTARYKTDDTAQNKKLDEMDLDDILTKADAFDTEASAQPGGTSLGGEGFLSQFAAIQDVKNDMDDGLSWDDIIPVEERVKLDEEESRRLQEQETASLNRKRAAARPPGTYEDMDFDDGEGKSSRAGSPDQKTSGKSKKGAAAAAGGAPRKSNAQKALELKGQSSYCGRW